MPRLGRHYRLGLAFHRGNRARGVVGETVVALLHAHAHGAAAGVGVHVYRHIGAVGHVFALQCAGYAVAAEFVAYAHVAGAQRVLRAEIADGSGGHFALAFAQQRFFVGGRLVEAGGAVVDGGVAFLSGVVTHVAVCVGNHAGLGAGGHQSQGGSGDCR